MTGREFSKDDHLAASAAPFWQDVYRRIYGMGRIVRHAGMSQANKDHGVDCTVVDLGGVSTHIQEKVRRPPRRSDMAIEYEHVFADGHVENGWIAKPLKCEVVAYGQPCAGVAHILHWQELRSAWRALGGMWVKTWHIAESWNIAGYTTKSVCVPWRTLQQAGVGVTSVCVQKYGYESDDRGGHFVPPMQTELAL